MPHSLKGRTALVTGSATGIGEAIARRLAREGASVMVHGQPEERDAGQRIAALIREETPGTAADFFAACLEEPDECEALVAAVAERFGGMDILVNNAACTARSNLETTDAATFDYIMAVNVRAPLLLIRAALPHFRRASSSSSGGGGRVLNIGSVNAYCGEPNLLAYSISKGALMTLTRNLADAYAEEGIRINQLNLGWVLTENEYRVKIADGMPEDWPRSVSPDAAPGGRLLTPEEIAHFAVSFLSDEAALINGTVAELSQRPVIGRNPPKVSGQ